MKKLFFAALLLVAFAAQAQTQRIGALNGHILDASTANIMDGALIQLRSVADTTYVRGGRSLPDGKFTIANLPYGEYTIEVSFIGYEEYHNKLTLNMRNMTVAPFYMNPSSLVADGVEVVAPMIRVSMHGDTTIYNAAAFKVAEDADAEAIVKQLPGVEVNEGQVTVNGKNVEKILVDGKETYGTDVQETMRTIPATMLESIKVYEKLSDFAETTGINDGDEYTVMDFQTGIKFAHWGDMSAMWGWEDMYAAGARWNIVTGSHRFGINGGANNTGALQSFSDMSTPGMFGGGGYGSMSSRYDGMSANSKTKNIASGLTYNYEPDEKFRVNANYRYGKSDNENVGFSETRYFNNPLYDQLLSNSLSESNSNNHNFGASSRWKIDNRNTLNMRANGSIFDNNSLWTGDQQYFEEALTDAVQSIVNGGDGDNSSYNLAAQMNYGLKIGNRGRSFRIGLEGNMSNNDATSNSVSNMMRNIDPYPIILDSTIMSRSLSTGKRHSVEWKAEYFEPLSPYLHALISADGEYDYSDNDRRTERWNYIGAFDNGAWEAWGESSGVGNQRDARHRIAPGLNYRKNNNEFQVRAGYSHHQLSGKSVLPSAWEDSRGFNALYFNLNFEKQLTPQKSIDVSFGSDTYTPDIEQLQGIDIISTNGISVSGGNKDLNVNNYYWTYLSYNAQNLRNSSSFSVYMNGSLNFNSIETSRFTITEDLEGWDAGSETWETPNGTALTAGQEYSQPINIDRTAYSIRVGSYYGRPLKSIKSNFNASINAGFSEHPGLVNGEHNTSRRQNYTLRASFNSNFSENLTIGLSYTVSPSWTNNTHKDYANERGLRQNASLNFYWLTWKNFVLRADARYSYADINQDGFARDYHLEYVMANVAIGKKFFKNKSGELTFAVNDLFNKSRQDSYNYSVDRVVYTRNRNLGRYYSLTFRYRLRRFSKDN